MKILFLHGWQSVPGGVKPTYLAEHGHTVNNPALPDEDFDAAVRVAQAEFDRHRPDVIVGSSRGGAVAMNVNAGDTPLVLLYPAWKKYGTATTVKPGTTILHSRADDVVPFADSEELVRNSGLPASALVEVGSDHRLADPEPLQPLVEHVIVEADQHAVLRLANVDLVSIAAQLERRPVRFQRILVRELGGPAVANDVVAFPSLGNLSMSSPCLLWRLGRDRRCGLSHGAWIRRDAHRRGKNCCQET